MRRIVFLIPTLDQIGGAERQVILLAKELAERDNQVTVIALSGSGSSASIELAAAGIDFLTLDMRKAWIDPRGWIRYLAWALHNRPDIAHAHLPHASWFARCIRLLLPVRVLIDTVHTSHTGSRLRQATYRLTHWLTSYVTCVSNSVADAILAARIAPRRSLTVLPNGVILPRPEIASNAPSEQAAFQWIAVGRLAPVKDYPTLLRAFAALPGSVTLRIVGTGPEEPALRRLTSQLNLDSQVHFSGFHRDVHAQLAAADAFVQSSLWEGLPVSILEASAAGLPIVATSASGTSEAVLHGRTGLLVPVGDVAALSQAMATVMAMPAAQRRAMGTCGRQFVAEHFSLTMIANQWEQLYSDLLNSHPRPSRWG